MSGSLRRSSLATWLPMTIMAECGVCMWLRMYSGSSANCRVDGSSAPVYIKRPRDKTDVAPAPITFCGSYTSCLWSIVSLWWMGIFVCTTRRKLCHHQPCNCKQHIINNCWFYAVNIEKEAYVVGNALVCPLKPGPSQRISELQDDSSLCIRVIRSSSCRGDWA